MNNTGPATLHSAMLIVSLHVCPRQEVVLYQTKVMRRHPLQSWYRVYALGMRLLTSLSSWSETLTRTALCVPPGKTYVYALGDGNVLEAVDVVTNKRRVGAQLEGLDRDTERFLDCNGEVLLVTDGRVTQVLQRGTYAVLHTIQLWSAFNFTNFTFVDDWHVFSLRAGECAGFIKHINNFTPKRHKSAVGTHVSVSGQVCVDRDAGFVNCCDGNLRRIGLDGKCWEMFIVSASASHRLRQAQAISYGCDHVAVFTKYGDFAIIPTQELRRAWMALCAAMIRCRVWQES